MSQKIPYITKEKAEQIAQKYPTPFYLYDEAGIRNFAVKATPNPYILQILKEEGCGADCSSLTELQMSHAAGLTGRDVMFSSNETPAEDMQLAKKMGAIINLDDLTHVEFLEQVAGIPETICCRFNPGGHFAIANSIMDNPGDSKYGMTREQMVQNADAEGRKAFWHPCVPCIQYRDQCVLSGAGPAAVHAGSGTERRNRGGYHVH